MGKVFSTSNWDFTVNIHSQLYYSVSCPKEWDIFNCLISCMWFSMWLAHAMEKTGVGSLLSWCKFSNSNSSHHVWQQTPILTKSSHSRFYIPKYCNREYNMCIWLLSLMIGQAISFMNFCSPYFQEALWVPAASTCMRSMLSKSQILHHGIQLLHRTRDQLCFHSLLLYTLSSQILQ